MAERDCACITHSGPHWLHLDTVAQRLNLALLEQVTTAEGLHAFGQAEARRLAELEEAMRQAGLPPNETIAAYLERAGWERYVIDACLKARQDVRAAIQAALARLAQQAKVA